MVTATEKYCVLNDYGDLLIPTSGIHGGDISSQRIDALDEACLDFIKKSVTENSTPRIAIDIGGGLAAQSKRMASAEASVYMIDLTDQQENIDRFNRTSNCVPIRFLCSDIRRLNLSMFGTNIGVIYSQRMLSCIEYSEANALLTELYTRCKPFAHCFISTGGIASEIGQTYSARNAPMDLRWATIAPAMAEKHQMYSPECLYTEAELRELLINCGFTIVESWTSPFGNPKIICRK
jgi:hypothetical protein